MNYEEFASDLPQQRMVFTSAEEMEETFKRFGIEQPMRQLGRGAFRSALAATFTKHADFFRTDTTEKFRCISRAPEM